ncbi:Hypothetical predicted protein, partial [Paramuricea clavata]
ESLPTSNTTLKSQSRARSTQGSRRPFGKPATGQRYLQLWSHLPKKRQNRISRQQLEEPLTVSLLQLLPASSKELLTIPWIPSSAP